MLEVEALTHAFLEDNGYTIIKQDSRTWIEKWEFSKDVQQTTWLAYIKVMNQKVWLKATAGLLNETDVRLFSIYSKDDFDKMLEYLRKREHESKSVTLSTSTGWDNHRYIAV